MSVLNLIEERERILRALCERLNSPPEGLLKKVSDLSRQLKEVSKELQRVKRGQAGVNLKELFDSAPDVNGTKVVASVLDGLSVDGLRSATDALKKMGKSVAIALGTIEKERPVVVVSLSQDLIDRGLHAGEIARGIAEVLEGGGGGKPHLAQAGGKRADKLQQSIERARELLGAKVREVFS